MQKSENKIKPMYFWSDGYKECGVLEPDPKKIREEELVDVTDDNVSEYVFEHPPARKKKRKISVEEEFKRWFRAHLERRKHYFF